jgi:hypothetical protein
MTHVYVSHLIQAQLDKEKASQIQVKPEERSHIRISTPPSGSTVNKNKAHFDASLPVQQSLGFRNAAGQQKMVSATAIQLAATCISSVIIYLYLDMLMWALSG